MMVCFNHSGRKSAAMLTADVNVSNKSISYNFFGIIVADTKSSLALEWTSVNKLYIFLTQRNFTSKLKQKGEKRLHIYLEKLIEEIAIEPK